MKLKAEGYLGAFRYSFNKRAIMYYHRRLSTQLKKEFKAGILNPPKTGVKYSNLPNRSSRGGEFPANQTGALMRSVNSNYDTYSVTVGSNKHYARYLAEGTEKMAARKMSKYVLQHTYIKYPSWVSMWVPKK